MLWFYLLSVFFMLNTTSSNGEKNLLENPEFEDEINGSNWGCRDEATCSMTRINRPFIGQYSAVVYNRSDSTEGCRQEVTNIKTNTAYKLSAVIKIINPVVEQHTMKLVVIQHIEYWNEREQVAIISDVRSNDGWIKMVGDFVTEPDCDYITVMFLVSEHEQVDYLVDSASLVEIEQDPQWQEKADERIEELRKGNAIFNFQTNGECSYNDLTIKVSKDSDGRSVHAISLQINQTKSSFPFGSSVVHRYLVGEGELGVKYRDYFNGLFNWGTPNSDMKWRIMEPVKGEVDFEKTDEMIEVLLQNGKKVRGHAMAWGKEEKLPEWLLGEEDEQINMEVQRRIRYMLERYSESVSNWDVLNENIEGQWLELNTGNLEFTQTMYTQMHQLQPEAGLFMNEYSIVTNGKFSSAYRRKVGAFLANGAPVHAVGIQSHFLEYDIVDIGVIQHRLDLMANAGLPLWITEFDLEDFDVSSRATKIGDLLRLYFSHPAIEGIVMWGFWSETNNMTTRGASLVDGEDFIENEAGAAVRNLFRNKWWTTTEEAVTSAQQVFRVFHGEHDIEVEIDGRSVWHGEMVVDKGTDTPITITIDCF
ncbi:hypothetical protein CAPTEDRAFT_217971 [Capitella teleta]|uniref:GH10 domain-containing protein n=1 Tax=Capitella teleta TaxID=283909 RepID=R7UX07_CAPTE|nr:hypothetical protein CAPTEDRAFT_217971 [Capitella teleta]|eukprot:ELU08452.1 hypothetical protein CAPTEDRAFT_217971 [Capitella teleta]